MKDPIRYEAACRVCESSGTTMVLKLRDTPLEDQFLTEIRHQPTFPLELCQCNDCGYLFLSHIVSPSISYCDYLYESSVTTGLKSHYDEYAKEVLNHYDIRPAALIVDLGSNDGSMLASFQRLGMEVLGVEPASAIAENATRKGLKTITGFFTADLAKEILHNYGPAQVVTANYMYANVEDLTEFTVAVKSLLSPDGIFVVQTGYHPEQMKNKMFDYIYHEHFSYFSITVIKNLFAKCGLELIDVCKTSPKGGSVRIIGQLKGGNRKISNHVEEIILEELTSGVHKRDLYEKFSKVILSAKNELTELLKSLKATGKKIIGLGASHSTTTLLYHFELAEFIEYIVDDNKAKHGTFSPGNHIPVYPTDRLYEDPPDYILILAWQHQDSIIQKHRMLLDKGCKFIIPLPSLKVIEGT